MTVHQPHMSEPQDRVPYEDEEEFEPMHGLPEVPPEGEKILWQGMPTVGSIANRVFHLKFVTFYFALLFGWAVYERMGDGVSFSTAMSQSTILIIPLGFVIALMLFLAWSIAKTSVYTLTNKRIVMRVGVSLSNAVNLPFAQIVGANERIGRDGTVDIAFSMTKDAKPHYLLLWPHLRPRNWSQVQPMLRGIGADDPVRQMLTDALMAYHNQDVSGAALTPASQDTGSNDTDILHGGAAAT